MSLQDVLRCTAFAAALALPGLAAAQQDFDACNFFASEDAEKALGTAVVPEPVNPKAKRPRFVPRCTYSGSKDGKAVAATAEFRFLKTEPEAQRAFDDSRLQLQTKPMLIAGADAFWSAKTGQMYVRKGRTTFSLAVGPSKLAERDLEQAKKLAEILLKKF